VLTAPVGTGWFVVNLTDVVVATDFFAGFLYTADTPFLGYDEFWSGRDFFYYIDSDIFDSFGATLYIRAYLRKIGPGGVDHYVLDNKQMSRPTIGGSFPNPFNSATSIEIDIPENIANCSVDIYNMSGKRVCNLHSGRASAGIYHFIWNGMDESSNQMPSGSYFVKVSHETGSETKKIIFLK